jgi:hypothetical protein
MSTWTNQYGETLRVEWEDDHAVLYHTDIDDVAITLDVRVVGFYQDANRVRESAPFRDQLGDVVLAREEQEWLLAEMVKLGLLDAKARKKAAKKP